MISVKCYSVRLKSLVSISDKAFKAIAFDGSEAIIPKSQVFGQDYDVQKCEAYWIAAWILEKKDLQYSNKKQAWHNLSTGQIEYDIKIEKHIPLKVKFQNVKPLESLKR
ncbi:MAG TPA: hypothetical protein PKE03_10265 [Bacteroidales bacterium]|jgi:hypothetical protein|nr:hypothetical protein [Bacteroidales bacterium]